MGFADALIKLESQSPYKGFNRISTAKKSFGTCLNPPIRGSIVKIILGLIMFAIGMALYQSPYKWFNR